MFFLISYNRPDRAREVIEQIKRVGCTTPGTLVVNGGNESGYKDIILPDGWGYAYNYENLGICGAMNELFRTFPNEPFYGLITDDELVKSPHWDTTLVQAAGKWKIAHGNDGWQSHRRIHGYVVCGGELVREMGFWSLPGLWHCFVDDVWEFLARELGLRRFCDDVITEHRHHMNMGAVKDSTYDSGEAKFLQDRAVFEKWVRNDSWDLIQRIQEKIPHERG